MIHVFGRLYERMNRGKKTTRKTTCRNKWHRFGRPQKNQTQLQGPQSTHVRGIIAEPNLSTSTPPVDQVSLLKHYQ